MASLPSLGFVEADELVVREVFARIDAQAGLPSVIETVERWRPDVLLRESAELASLAAAERAGVPHVHVCIGMHEVATRFAEVIGGPLEELGRLAGLGDGRLPAALAAETVFSAVPDVLDHAAGDVPPEAEAFLRFHERTPATDSHDLPDWGDPDAPLVYVTFGSVTGSLPHLAGVYREAVDVLADVEARVLITVGRKLEPAVLGPLPSNVHATQWWPQAAVLAQAAAMLGHGGFGTTMGALAAGVPQVVAPLFTFDQIVNGEHVAAVGAGIATERGAVRQAAEQVSLLLEDRDVRRVRSPRRGGDARSCRRPRRPCPCSPAWSAERRLLHFGALTLSSPTTNGSTTQMRLLVPICPPHLVADVLGAEQRCLRCPQVDPGTGAPPRRAGRPPVCSSSSLVPWARVLPAADARVPLDRGAAEGRRGEPAVDRCGVRRARDGLPVGLGQQPDRPEGEHQSGARPA